MARFDELVADPDYQALDTETQYRVRKAFLQQKVAADPEFSKLDEEQRHKVTKSILFPGEEEGPTMGQKIATSKAGDAVEFGLSALSRIAPPIATGDVSAPIEAVRSFDERVAQTSRKLGDKGAAALVEGFRGAGSLAVPFLPRAVTDLLGTAIEGVKHGAEAVGLPDPITELSPDVAMMLAMGLAPRAIPKPAAAPPYARGINLLKRERGKLGDLPVREKATPFTQLEDIPGPEATDLLRTKAERAQVRQEAIKRALDEAEVSADTPKSPQLAAEKPTSLPQAELSETKATVTPTPKVLDVKKASVLDLIKEGFGDETGSVGKLTPEQEASGANARAARKELVVRGYHASPKIFEKFADNPLPRTKESDLTAKGTFFYGDRFDAERLHFPKGKQKHIYEADVSFDNPFEFKNYKELYDYTGVSHLDANKAEKITSALKAKGHDGFVKHYQTKPGIDEMAVFDSNKIRNIPDLSKASFGQLLKKSFTETGAIGKLAPEQEAAEAAARMARKELYERVSERSAATGESLQEAGKKLGLAEAMVNRLGRESSIERVDQKLQETTSALENLNKKGLTLTNEAETIQKTGTIAEAERAPFREEGAKPQTIGTRFSEQDIIDSQAKVIATAREIKDLHAKIEEATGQSSVDLKKYLDSAVQKMNSHAAEFRKLRFAAGRAVKRFDRAVPEDVIQDLRDAGIMLKELSKAKDRPPIYTSILDKASRISSLTGSEWAQLGRDLVDAYRLNIFGVGSPVRDVLSNVAQLTVETNAGIGRDLVRLAKGDASFPSIQAAFRAIRRTKTAELAAGKAEIRSGAMIENALSERIAGGEKLASGFSGDRGVFTMRDGKASTFVDYAVGTPLYMKSFVDSGAKRFAATRSLWEDATAQANKLRLKGLDRQRFLDEFFQAPPEAALDRAIVEGNKAGFNRPLSSFEKRVAGNKFYQLMGDGFARWPFQFTRWAVDVLGADPQFWGKVKRGAASTEDIGGLIGKAATGWGGLVLVSDMIYDNVDFKTLSYIHADGERTLLTNLEPITTALFQVALWKGDTEKVLAGLRAGSVPFAKFLLGEGGLLGSTINQLEIAAKNGKVDSGGVKRELVNTVNRAIPGQGLLSAIKTLFDPTNREGIGANLPGSAAFAEPVINRATGKPHEPNRELLGVESPRIGGLAIPGATTVTDPVTRLFTHFDLLLNRGKRQPIAGNYPDEIPHGLEREFDKRLGENRQKLLSRFAQNTLDQIEKHPELLKNKQWREATKKRIQNLDALAARQAKLSLDAEAKAPSKLPKRATLAERRGPVR